MQSSPKYWKVQKRFSNLKFRINRRAFLIKSGIFEVNQKSAIFRWILLNIILKVALAIIVVAILTLLEQMFPAVCSLKLKPEEEYGFLGTLAQVSAMMLGLYFTAVSLVASTAYARVPGDVRAMIAEEQIGNFYFSFLAQFAASAIVMLSIVSFGIPVGSLNVLWLSFLGLFSVFSFVVLGVRTFSFFDPAALVQHLNHRLVLAMDEVTPSGYKWLDPSFQNHHQRQADRTIEAYTNLVVIAEQSENLNSRALVELAKGLINILSHYSAIKGCVPTKSLWFRRRPQHKQWLLAPYHEVEMARATDTAIQPEMVPDLQWFETKVNQVLARIVSRLSARSDLAGLISVLDVAQIYSRTAATLGGTEEALLLLETLGIEINKTFEKVTFDSASDQSLEQSLNRLAVFDLHALGLLNVLLGTSHALEANSRAAFEQKIDRIEWNKMSSLYCGHLPRAVLLQCEEMQEQLSFEYDIEGSLITPNWLRREFAALGYARFLDSVAGRVLAGFETHFGELVEQRMKVNDHVGAALLINRGLEATNKLNAHLADIHEWWDALLELNRSRDWEWPEINWNDASKRTLALRDRLVKNLVSRIGSLMDLPKQKQVPDFFGQAYSILSDSCFDSLIRDDEAMFSAIFPTYFLTAIEAHQKVRGTLGKITSNNLSATLGPLSDLLSISGFAELYSALTMKNFSTLCRKTWDSYFAGHKDDASRKAVIDVLTLTKKPLLGMSSRDMLRFRWEQATRHHLETKGIAFNKFGFDPRRDGSVRHPNPLVRVFAARGDILNDAIDIFLAVYLFRRPEAAGIKLPPAVESYQRALSREESSEENDNETP